MFTLYPGSVFAQRYRVVSELASGSMGMLYRVEHIETGRPCALKVMLPGTSRTGDLRQRFEAEAKAAAAVQSEYVVQVFDAGVDPASDTPFFVMELLVGEDLERRLKRGPVDAAETVRLLRQAGSALDRLHQSGVIHRDLKPENIFLTETELGEAKVKLVDFGVARLFEDSGAITSTKAVGTPLYMPPEQYQSARRITPAVDIYALGLIAFAMLTGHHYFTWERDHSTSFVSFIKGICTGPREAGSVRAARFGARLPESFDPWLATVCHAAPERRYQRASEAVLALADALGLGRLAQPSLHSFSGQYEYQPPPQVLAAAPAQPTPPPAIPAQQPAPPPALQAIPGLQQTNRRRRAKTEMVVDQSFPELSPQAIQAQAAKARDSAPRHPAPGPPHSASDSGVSQLAGASGPYPALSQASQSGAAISTGSVSISRPRPRSQGTSQRSAVLVGVSIAGLLVCVGAGAALLVLSNRDAGESGAGLTGAPPAASAIPVAAAATAGITATADLDVAGLPVASSDSGGGASPPATTAAAEPAKPRPKSTAELKPSAPAKPSAEPKPGKPIVEAPPNPYGD